MQPPEKVLSHYPSWLGDHFVFLGNRGGFSGALLWKLDAPERGVYCLKAWPVGWRSAQELTWIHGLLGHAQALPYLARILPTVEGVTQVAHAGRLWDVTSWLPGRADFSQAPSRLRLRAACLALAQLHHCWTPLGTGAEVCPAVLRRLAAVGSWRQLLRSGWHPAWPLLDPFSTLAQELWTLVNRHVEEVPRLLSPWLQRKLPVQPCICDVWHDHILFEGDLVTGIIDFGSAKIDHVAVDLARLLGSLVGDDVIQWHEGMNAYAELLPLGEQERGLARDLDRTGTIIAGTTWLRWLYHEGRCFEPTAALARLTQLVQRLRAGPVS